jgi:hypothetical protein
MRDNDDVTNAGKLAVDESVSRTVEVWGSYPGFASRGTPTRGSGVNQFLARTPTTDNLAGDVAVRVMSV